MSNASTMGTPYHIARYIPGCSNSDVHINRHHIHNIPSYYMYIYTMYVYIVGYNIGAIGYAHRQPCMPACTIARSSCTEKRSNPFHKANLLWNPYNFIQLQ